MNMAKAAYEAPVLRVHGKVETLTRGGATGATSDAVFPVGTPATDVTFS